MHRAALLKGVALDASPPSRLTSNPDGPGTPIAANTTCLKAFDDGHRDCKNPGLRFSPDGHDGGAQLRREAPLRRAKTGFWKFSDPQPHAKNAYISWGSRWPVRLERMVVWWSLEQRSEPGTNLLCAPGGRQLEAGRPTSTEPTARSTQSHAPQPFRMVATRRLGKLWPTVRWRQGTCGRVEELQLTVVFV